MRKKKFILRIFSVKLVKNTAKKLRIMSSTQIYIFCPFFRQARFLLHHTNVYARMACFTTTSPFRYFTYFSNCEIGAKVAYSLLTLVCIF